MDMALRLFESGNGDAGIELVVDVLDSTRRAMSTAAWRSFSKWALTHPITRYLHADPMTHRAFTKPRGYAGDAVMMDYLYGLESPTVEPAVRPITRYITTDALSARAVRHRRQVLASAIDTLVAERGRGAATAVAAGHLRELSLSTAARDGRVTITAIDQDEVSLELIGREYGHLGAVPVPGSVRQILTGRLVLPPADLVYAAGLYDYLTEPVAQRLTQLMFDSVTPGGRLLLANFLPDIPDVGYMESFMDWHLIYRSDAQMRAFADALAVREVASVRQFRDPYNVVTYLEVTKR